MSSEIINMGPQNNVGDHYDESHFIDSGLINFYTL